MVNPRWLKDYTILMGMFKEAEIVKIRKDGNEKPKWAPKNHRLKVGPL